MIIFSFFKKYLRKLNATVCNFCFANLINKCIINSQLNEKSLFHLLPLSYAPKILVACSDNLTGMSDAIEAVFPKTQHQLCIVHQIRNSLKFVPYKDRKLVANDLKSIYTAINEEIALVALFHFSEKWNKKYPQITKSWKNNWNNLIIFLEYPQEFRRIIYTTNAIESVNSQLRKVIKNKKIFPNDASVFKIFYLAFQNMVKKWTMPIQN